MTELVDLPDPLVRALCYRESLHKLGFPDDDVCILFGRTIMNADADPGPGQLQCEVILVDRSKVMPLLRVGPDAIRFSIACGPIEARWNDEAGRAAMIARWNRLSRDARHALWESHQPQHLFNGLTEALMRKGIMPPALDELRSN